MQKRTAIIFFIIVLVALQYPSISVLLNWDRSLIAKGEAWRVITGSFTHSNLIHLVMNIIGLVMIQLIFKSPAKKLIGLVITCSAMIGVFMHLTQYEEYVGISGTLHGLFAYFAAMEALSSKREAWLMVAGIIIKVASECAFGASEHTSNLIGVAVAYEAHLIGMISGFALAIAVNVISIFERTKCQSIHKGNQR